MKTGKAIGLALHGLMILVVLLALAGSVLYLLAGSQEMYPTARQEEKIRIVFGTLSILFAALEIVLISVFVKLIKKRPKSAEHEN